MTPPTSSHDPEGKRSSVTRRGVHLNGHHIPWSVIVLTVSLILTADRAFRRLGDLESDLAMHVKSSNQEQVERRVMILEERMRQLMLQWNGL